MTTYKKMLLWILIPFIYGLMANTFLVIIPPFLSQIIFGVFWFWIGVKSAQLSGNSIKDFFLVNSLWLLSFLLFLWQFLIVDDASRNLFISGISQHYALAFIWIGTKLSLMFSDILHSTTIMVTSYLSMIVVFTIGFIVGKVKT